MKFILENARPIFFIGLIILALAFFFELVWKVEYLKNVFAGIGTGLIVIVVLSGIITMVINWFKK